MDITKQHDDLRLGEWLGRRQAYSLVAGNCSAADAKCLAEMRQEKLYKRLQMTWEDFCKQRLGMHRTKADEIIRQWKEFGATYFTLHQITGVSPDEYRAIRGAIEDGSLRYSGGAIPIQAEQAPLLLEAVRELAPAPAPKPKPAEEGYTPSPYRIAKEALVDARLAIKKLRDCGIADEDHHELQELITTLSLEMRLIARLSMQT